MYSPLLLLFALCKHFNKFGSSGSKRQPFAKAAAAALHLGLLKFLSRETINGWPRNTSLITTVARLYYNRISLSQWRTPTRTSITSSFSSMINHSGIAFAESATTRLVPPQLNVLLHIQKLQAWLVATRSPRTLLRAPAPAQVLIQATKPAFNLA